MDVKPDNIYSSEDGTYKLGDFGLATMRAGDPGLAVEEGDCRCLSRSMQATLSTTLQWLCLHVQRVAQ